MSRGASGCGGHKPIFFPRKEGLGNKTHWPTIHTPSRRHPPHLVDIHPTLSTHTSSTHSIPLKPQSHPPAIWPFHLCPAPSLLCFTYPSRPLYTSVEGMSHPPTCSYRRLNPSRTFIQKAPTKTFFLDRTKYPTSDKSSLGEDTSGAIIAEGNNDDPPIWWLRAQSSFPSNTVMVQPQIPSQRAQSQSSPFHRLIGSRDPETRSIGQAGGSVRDECGLPQALPTSSASEYPLSTISAVHATSASSAPAPPAINTSITATNTPITSNGEMEPDCQLAVKNTPEESVHSFGTKVKDHGQQDVLEDKSEHESDGEVSESGWTTASGGMAFSFSFVDGKPFAQPIVSTLLKKELISVLSLIVIFGGCS